MKRKLKRKLLDGTTRPEVEKPVVCFVETKCPRKWVFIDMGEGNIYIPDGKGKWLRATDSELRLITYVVRGEVRERKRYESMREAK